MKNRVLFAMPDERNMTEPMGIMLLSALAKRQGWDTDLVVLERDDIADVVRKKKPDVVAFSAITGSHQLLLAANAAVKKAAPSIKTVIGGPYATFRPQLVLEQDFDALGVGECDDAWPELLDAWAAGRSIDAIHNIITPQNAPRVLKRTLLGKDGWIILPEHLRPRKTALDDLPYLDREIVYEHTAFKTRYKRTIMAGRGCPFRCTYCFEHAWNEMYTGKGNVLQRHSPRRVCEELAALKRGYETHFIKFYDDVFPVFDKTDDAWLEEFAELYPRMVGLPFHCLVRAELVNEQSARKLRLLKQAGIASITMSIEAGNAFSRDYVLIRDMTGEDLRNSFAICRKLGIPTFANTILAVPVPTLPDVNATQDAYDAKLKLILSIAAEVDPKRKRRTKQLGELVAEAQASSSNERDRRMAVDRVLRSLGVRETQIEYDKDSVEENVRWQASFTEFPVLFPYDGTQLGAYCERHGFFDGDYDKLHASYQTTSPLDCFTEHEKLQQQNLAMLGTILSLFAGSTNPVLNAMAKPLTWLATEVLAGLPITKQLVPIYSLLKNYMHQTRVYPMGNVSVSARARNAVENLALDVFKQLRRTTGKKPATSVRVGQTLGGSAAP